MELIEMKKKKMLPTKLSRKPFTAAAKLTVYLSEPALTYWSVCNELKIQLDFNRKSRPMRVRERARAKLCGLNTVAVVAHVKGKKK